MSKIVHLCLGNFYIDNYGYQENMLPKYHVLQGHEVTVIASLLSFDGDGRLTVLPKPSVYESADRYQVIRINYRKPWGKLSRFLRCYEGVYELLEQEKPEIIFIHNCQFLDIRNVVRYVKRHPDIQVFADNHGDYVNSATNWFSKHILHRFLWRKCARQLLPYVNKFYGVLPLRCRFLEEMYDIPASKIELLVMGVDDASVRFDEREHVRQRVRQELNLSPQDFVLITGGKIDKKKNIHLLMKAVTELDLENLKLIVFGNVSPDMKQEIEALSTHTGIRNIGWVSSAQVFDYYFAADLAVFPGTHSVLWEQAVGCGLPAVFKYWEGMTHVDLQGNCCFLYKDSAEEMKEVIGRICSDRSLYEEMKKAAAERGQREFAYSKIAREAIKF